MECLNDMYAQLHSVSSTYSTYFVNRYRNWSSGWTYWLKNASNNITFVTFLCGALCIYIKTIEYIANFQPLCTLYTTKSICGDYFSLTFFFGEGLGAFFNFILTDTLGRQKTLLYTIVVYSVLSSWLLFDKNYTFLYHIARFCCGYGIGIIESVTPLFAAGNE